MPLGRRRNAAFRMASMLDPSTPVGSTRIWSRAIHQWVGTREEDNVFFTFVKEKMKSLVIHPSKNYGWNQKGETVDVLPAMKNEELKDLVDRLTGRVEGSFYAHCLKSAARVKNLTQGKRIHNHIRRGGRIREEFLAHLIVKMYIECGSLEDAKEIFYRSPRLESPIWREMLWLCAYQGNRAEVFKVYRSMHQAGIIQQKQVLLAVLYVCARTVDLELVKQVHEDLVFWGFDSYVLAANALVGIYARCGRLDISKLVFDGIERPIVASFNALIGAYVRYGYYEEAFELFWRMNVEGYIPSRATYAAVLSACVNPLYLKEGRMFHHYAYIQQFERGRIVGAALVKMYGMCGELFEAQQVFDIIFNREVATWTNMIEVYVNRGLTEQAFITYEAMRVQRIAPSKVTFVTLLNACHSPEWLEKGRLLHSSILRHGWESNLRTAAALFRMYSRCGSLTDARRVFDKLHQANALVWNAAIDSYVERLYSREALELVWRMHQEGVKGDNDSYATGFRACAQMKALNEGMRLHSVIQGSELEMDALVGSSLLWFYSSCGRMNELRRTFSKMDKGKVASWNSAISAAAHAGWTAEAAEFFQWMQLEGAPPDSETFGYLLDSLTSLEQGKIIYKCILESGLLNSLAVGNALLDMFGRLKLLRLASKTFEAMPLVSVYSWTSIIAAFSQSGFNGEALKLFRDMLQEGYIPDRRCFATILNVIADLESVVDGEQVENWMLETQLELDSDALVGAALSNMYARCGRLEEAQEAFDNIQIRDVGCWNALMRAYVREGQHEAVLDLFQEMQLKPDHETFATVLEAVCGLEDLQLGKEIHLRAVELKLESDPLVANSLLNMYRRLEDLQGFKMVFDNMQEKNCSVWNNLFSTYGRLQNGAQALKLFKRMVQEGVSPDSTSFNIILSICSSGEPSLIDQGCNLAASMKNDYLIIPTIQHRNAVCRLRECTTGIPGNL